MKSIIIGTAGHVDHGKSSLVMALTGTDPDRLAYEKEHNITTELGFADLHLGPELTAGIIDVPGHERFVKHMVAGTGGIDIVMMVIAADEGIMPQTREHLDICELLGLRVGVVVLSKIDLIDDSEWMEMVEEDLRNELADTILSESPLIKVSTKTGEGLEQLKQTLAQIGASVHRRSIEGPAYLPIDRVFSMKGFGTVVTGTLFSGELRIDDEVDVVPDPQKRLRGLHVRGLQNHGEQQQFACAGQRLAMNLAGVEKSKIHRGQVVIHHDAMEVGQVLEASFHLLPGAKSLRTQKKLLLHIGTAKTSARVKFVGTNTLEPGQQTYVRLVCHEEIAALPGQHFIIRGFYPIPGRGSTLGGGQVLSILPVRRSRNDQRLLEELKILDEGTLQEKLAVFLQRADWLGLSLTELIMHTNLGRKSIERELAMMLTNKQVYKYDRDRNRYVSATTIENLTADAVEILHQFHQAEPLLPGMPKEHLRSSLHPKLDPKLFRQVVSALEKKNVAVFEGETARLAKHQVRLGVDQDKLQKSIIEMYDSAALTPPRLSIAAEELAVGVDQVKDILGHLTRTGVITYLTGDLFISTQAVLALQQKLIGYLQENKKIDTQTFKNMVGASRKHVIPLAEYFDRQRITLRVGDSRMLRGGQRPSGNE